MALKSDAHQNEAKKLTQALSNGQIPFDVAQDLAKATVKAMVKQKHPRIKVKSCPNSKNTLRPANAWHHYGVYFLFDYPGAGGTRTVLAALGYDYRHWVSTFGWPDEPQIPWRLFLCECNQQAPACPDHPYLPPRVEGRIQDSPPSWSGWPMRDGLTWVYTGPEKGQDYPFIRIPKKALEQLPSSISDPGYVSKLADAVFTFLDDLFKP